VENSNNNTDIPPVDELEYDPFAIFVAPFTFNYERLHFIARHDEFTIHAVLIIVLVRLLDYGNVQGINMRFNYTMNGQLSPASILLQPVYILYIALVMKFIMSYQGQEYDVLNFFRVIGFSSLWTPISVIVYSFINLLDSSVLTTIVGVLFFFLYFWSMGVAFAPEQNWRSYLRTAIILGFSALLAMVALFVVAIPIFSVIF